MRVLLLFLLSIGLAACSAAGVSGSVNGVEFRSAVHRPAVPGGTKISIAVHMLEGSATEGQLYVDGVDFSRVQTGDQVRVDKQAIVRINGVVREPMRGEG